MTPEEAEIDIEFVSSANDVKDETLRRIYDNWVAATGDAAFPEHEAISILDFPMEARFWCVLDVENHGTDFRCRFFGPDFVEFVGADVTGKLMSEFRHELPGQLFQERALATMRIVMNHQGPVTVAPRRSVAENKEYAVFSSLTLPFSRNGDKITRILHAVTVSREPMA